MFDYEIRKLVEQFCRGYLGLRPQKVKLFARAREKERVSLSGERNFNLIVTATVAFRTKRVNESLS